MGEEKQLKSGWRVWRFEQMAVNVKTKIDDPSKADVDYYVGLEHLDPDSLKIRRWGHPSDVEAQKLCFKKGDIIFGKRRVYQRKLGVAEWDGICSAHAFVLRAKPDVVLPEFLPFFMQSDLFMERAQAISVGSLSPTINWKRLAKEEFALPPLEEQKRITEKCKSYFNAIEIYKKSLDELNKLRSATQHHLFTKGIKSQATRKERNQEMPREWQLKPLGKVFDFLDNKRVPLKESERQSRPGIYPYYGASGPIDYINDFIFDEPTLLLAEDGMNLLDRNSPIIYKATGKYWVSNHAHVLKPLAGTDIDFYHEYLEYISYIPYVTGTYQKKITQSDCIRIPVIYPPFDEQLHIAKILSEIKSKKQCLEKRLHSIQQLWSKALLEVFE